MSGIDIARNQLGDLQDVHLEEQPIHSANMDLIVFFYDSDMVKC